MSLYYKDLSGPHFETLSKAIYDKSLARVADPSEIYIPLLVLPRSIIAWLVANVMPLQQDAALTDFEVPGRPDYKLRIRKLSEDRYSGDIIHKAKIIHNFEMIPLPTVGGMLLHVCSLYDEVAGRKVEDVEKKELAEKAKDPSLHDVMSKLGELMDKISSSEKMRKDEILADEKRAHEARNIAKDIPAPQPVVVNINMSDIGNMRASHSAEKAKEIPVKEGEKISAEAEMAKDEILPGGKGDSKKDSDFDAKEVKMGHKTESEHTSSKKAAAEITRDHLSENPKYYKKLKAAGLADELDKASISGQSRKAAEDKEIARRTQVQTSDINQSPASIKSFADRLKAAAGKRAGLRNARSSGDPLKEMGYAQTVSYKPGMDAPEVTAAFEPSIREPGVKINPKQAGGESVQGQLVRQNKYASARTRAGQILDRLRAQKSPNLPKAQLEKGDMKGMKGPETGAKGTNVAPQAAAPKAPAQKGAKVPTLAMPKDTAASMPSIARQPAAGIPTTPAKAAAPKMPGMPKIKKEELEEATSDSGQKMFVRDGDDYIFNPSGTHAVMTKDSLEIRKSEDGTYRLFLDRSQWDQDNVLLLSHILKARKTLKKFGF